MSVPFNHSPAEIVRKLLVGYGVGADPTVNPLGEWPVYVDSEPTGPDNCLTVYDTNQTDDGRCMIDGETWQHHGFQVRIRAIDHNTGYVKAESIRRKLDEHVYAIVITLVKTSGGNALYNVASIANTNLMRLGKDNPSSKRNLFTVNAIAAITAVS